MVHENTDAGSLGICIWHWFKYESHTCLLLFSPRDSSHSGQGQSCIYKIFFSFYLVSFVCFVFAFFFFFKVKWSESPQLCLTLCDPMDSTVHGILQARILECVAVPFSRGFSQPRDRTQVSHAAGGFFTSSSVLDFLYFFIDEYLFDNLFFL